MPDRVPHLILASGSPRRRELLAALGLEFSVRPVEIDETPREGEVAEPYVRRVAGEKAAAIVGEPGELVLAADTIVVLDGRLLGKPADPEAARAMLRELSGRSHTVKTAVALRELAVGGDAGVGTERWATHVESTEVCMAEISERDIDWYVGSGEPLDKAGAYGAQGLGSLFIEEIRGNYLGVIGLPLPALVRLFRELDYELGDWRRDGA
jgi:nucleoside triphosphate pyrophosphatase